MNRLIKKIQKLFICELYKTIFKTDYFFDKRHKKKDTKDTKDTHTSIMHTYKINRGKKSALTF